MSADPFWRENGAPSRPRSTVRFSHERGGFSRSSRRIFNRSLRSLSLVVPRYRRSRLFRTLQRLSNLKTYNLRMLRMIYGKLMIIFRHLFLPPRLAKNFFRCSRETANATEIKVLLCETVCQSTELSEREKARESKRERRSFKMPEIEKYFSHLTNYKAAHENSQRLVSR